jgi:hypothetical protein
VLDFAIPEPVPAPMTTIAWRLGHLYAGFSGRWEWTFGGRQKTRETIGFAPKATEMLDRLWALTDQWHDSIAAMTDEQLDMVGFGQYQGLDPYIPFICIVWWMNRELILHTGEVALLRDLWTAQHQRRD